MATKLKLQGSMTALVTPFKDGKLDLAAFEKHCEWQIEQGTSVLVPAGTTGETPALSKDEQLAVIAAAVKIARGRVPVVGGSGKNGTADTIEMTRAVKEAGADAALVVTPYYNKPTQEGLVRHFLAVADAVEIPIVLYNVPGRTGVNMTAETTARIAEHPRVIATKEASGDLVQASEILRLCGSRLALISGEDALTFPLMALGATGVISVVSNVAPAKMAKMCKAALAGDLPAARAAHLELLPLAKALFVETSPGPTKYALSKMGRMRAEMRLPLVDVSDATKKKVDEALAGLGIAGEGRE